MKVHTTNYLNTFIQIAEDCSAQEGIMPPEKPDKKTIANYQFEMIYHNPYKFSSDDVLFTIYAIRNEISDINLDDERKTFFSKGQACLRASPLTKTYGWGIHCDQNGKIALISAGSPEYDNFLANPTIQKVKAMRAKK